jgi:multimeric flavodoxin WrbA
MSGKIVIINGSPKSNGNTSRLAEWFAEGCRSKGVDVEIFNVGSFTFTTCGCNSCRACQKLPGYECIIKDKAQPVLEKMIAADVIVMATPLYFFAMSAQMKVIVDRMFSLYKWDNAAGTMKTCLKGKTLVLLASAFEAVGLDALEKPFSLTAEYSGMSFRSLLIANAGVSGDIVKAAGAREKAFRLGTAIAG